MIEALAPLCERIEVAGSIRRGKSHVKDVELVVIARSVPVGLFGEKESAIEHRLPAVLEETGWLQLARKDNGKIRANGPKYKRLEAAAGINRRTPVPIDLFIVTRDSCACT